MFIVRRVSLLNNMNLKHLFSISICLNVLPLFLSAANHFYFLFFLLLLFPFSWKEAAEAFVENKGVEPLTSCVQGRRSSQLS